MLLFSYEKLICMTVMLAFVFACKEKPKNPVPSTVIP